MRKCSTLMIFLSSSLLFILQALHVTNAASCYGSSFNGDSSRYAHNRRRLLSSLPNGVVTNGGFYNASVGQKINRVYALGLCIRGYRTESCFSCITKWALDTQTSCPGRIGSYVWAADEMDRVLCLVRTSRNSTFGNLELSSPSIGASPHGLASKNSTLFAQEWDATANRTLEAATKAENSSVKYYSAVHAEFTEFEDVYMLMLCTPDLTSQDCKRCLEACVTFYRKEFAGRQGGMASFPSCLFRWDLYPFHNAFGNLTRVPAPPRPPAKENECSITNKKGRSISHKDFIVTIVVLTFIFLLVFFGYNKFYARRIKSYSRFSGAEFSDSDGQFMLRFNLGTILMATNDFSSENTLGQGGFGTVYKGTLLNGKEIAVKRLKRGSSQGNMEFKNEVSLLTRLQHRNLVKLLGFCSEEDEEVLVYEFVPNSSLDHFIFDEEKRSLLTWGVRCKIMEGIARGLLYLHEDSQLKIIHRDLKASNILLDEEMNPKVADFGTARLFESDETRAETKRIAGTRGYMAPEYLNHGQISPKSDVYSFGVMLLEMISGVKNNTFEGEGLPVFAWKRWVEEKPDMIIDHMLKEIPRMEIIKLIQIGLLCVQENAANRPTMGSVIIWLGIETTTIPLPKAPANTWVQSETESDIILQMSDVFTELSSR